MKRTLVIAGLVLGGLGIAVPAGLAASPDTSVPVDIPEACLSPAAPDGEDYIVPPPPGPSRRPHVIDLPDCEDYPEICIILVPGQDAVAPDNGPARRPHGETPVPCAGAEPACTFTLVGDDGQVIDLNPVGPSRRPHGQPQPELDVVVVTDECQTYLESLALPPTGSGAVPLVVGAALVATGGVLLTLRRRRLAA